MFGDSHNSSTNYCKNADEKDDYEDYDLYDDDEEDGEGGLARQIKIGHYRVFNKYFLKLLSDIVSYDGVVDFYIEGGEIHKRKRDIIPKMKEFPMNKFWRLFYKCYYNERMDQTQIQKNYYNFCAKYTKNIRWQSGDARFFQQTNKKLDLGEFLEDFITKYRIKYFGRDKEDNFSNFYNFCHEEILLYPRDLNWRIDLEKAKIDRGSIFDEYVNKRGSLIRKQLDKITNDDLRKELITRFKNYIDNIDREYLNDENRAFLIKAFTDFQDLLKCEPRSNDAYEFIDIIWNMYQNKELIRFLGLLIKLRAIMADLYILARCYKIMNNLATNLDSHLTEPLINACYFGGMHMENIKNFLTKKNGEYPDYNLIMGISNINHNLNTHGQNRCLTIKDNLDMDGLIDRLIRRRKKHIEDLQKKEKYEKYKDMTKK